MSDIKYSVGDKIEIELVDQYNNTEIFKSTIVEINGKNEIKVMAPIKNRKLVYVSEDKVYNINFYLKKGVFRSKFQKIKDDIINKVNIIEISLLTNLEKYQRRQFFRLNKTLDILYQKDEGKVNNRNWLRGKTIDISGGGIRFISDKMIPANDNLYCKLIIKNEQTLIDISFYGKILTSQMINNNVGKYENRIEFEQISVQNQEILIKYIFDEQRLLRRRQKGMM